MHRKSPTYRKTIACCLVTIAVGGSAAMAASTLDQIPLMTARTDGVALGNGGTATEGRVIVVTPTGTPVVGGLAAGASISGFIYTPASGTRGLVGGTSQWGFSVVNGLSYRMYLGNPQLMAHGLSSGHSAVVYNDANGEGGWLRGWRKTDVAVPRMGTSGTLGSLGNTDVFYVGFFNNDNGDNLYTEKGAGAPDPASTTNPLIRDTKGTTTESRLSGQSGTGLSVCRRKIDGTNFSNYFLQWNGGVSGTGGTQYSGTLNGLAGNSRGEAWGVTADGTKVVGVSPVSDGRTGLWPYLMTVVPSTTAIPTQTSILELPVYPDAPPAAASHGYPYAISQDGSFAAGNNYRAVERAVIWDLRSTPAVYDLTDHFEAIGQLGVFSRLVRAYGAYYDAANSKLWVTGYGVLAAGGATRGFIVSVDVSELPWPAVGACCEPGTCSSKLESNCPVGSGAIFTPNGTCLTAACPGACCLPNGTCAVESPTACSADGGNFRGSSTICDASTCLGACCRGFATCEQVVLGTCDGDFKGVGASCATANCPCTQGSQVWADADLDGDVDQDDFAVFQKCYTGPPQFAVPIPAGCGCFDRTVTSPPAIDDSDLAELKKCVTGPGIKLDINNLPPGCTP